MTLFSYAESLKRTQKSFHAQKSMPTLVAPVLPEEIGTIIHTCIVITENIAMPLPGCGGIRYFEKGSILDITDMTEIYSIPKEEFEMTYTIIE